MTNEEFFRFCEKRSSTEGSASREVAVADVWTFLWAQGGPPELPLPEEIVAFLEQRIVESERSSLVEAYTWLKTVLTQKKGSPVSEQVQEVER